MRKTIAMVLAATFLTMTGCAPQMGPKETGGTLIGAGTGALIGSQFGGGRGQMAAVAIGTLAGALIGQGVGQSLDRADQLAMQNNAQYTLENAQTHATSTWRNPDTGNYGNFTPTATFQGQSGQYCREYVQTVYVGGQAQQAYGTACRQPDGRWLIVK